MIVVTNTLISNRSLDNNVVLFIENATPHYLLDVLMYLSSS